MIASAFSHLSTWFLHYTGSDNPAGPQYGFWSGFGSDLGEVAIIGGLLTVVRHHNCGVKGCWRIGKLQVDGTGHKTCHKHSTAHYHNLLGDLHHGHWHSQPK